MRMRDEFGSLYTDEDFAALFPSRGQPAESPWRLALVSVMQYVEHLSDRQAADAVRGRIDGKYALSLDLTDPGFDASVLSEFRTRVLAGGVEEQFLNLMLTLFRERKLLKARGRQRTDSTHVLAAIRALSRLQCVHEAMRSVLNTLAVVAPGWVCKHGDPAWVKRYERRLDDARLPESTEKRRELAENIGRDGQTLLSAVFAFMAPPWLREIPAVETLQPMWVQQYVVQDDVLRWRTEEDGLPPSAVFLSSPYDLDAHLAKKGTTMWIGSKAHLTETCEEDMPHLIINVETSSGPIADGEMTPTVHQSLEEKDLLPETHMAEELRHSITARVGGYLAARALPSGAA
jgi:transposase